LSHNYLFSKLREIIKDMIFRKAFLLFCFLVLFFVFPSLTLASGGTSEGHGVASITFLSLAILLIAAKLGGIIEKFGLPGVLGEMAAGILLSTLGFLGLGIIDNLRKDQIIMFLAEFGAVILLFQIGLESNIKELVKVGGRAGIIAIIGAFLPFVLSSFFLTPLLFPESTLITRLFIGATLVATSVSITVSVYHSLHETKTRAFKTFLGATLIDDILGLLMLAIVSAMAAGGDVSISTIAALTAKAIAFIGFSIILGVKLAPFFSNLFSKIHTGTGMKMGIAISLALAYAYTATLVGLAPTVGAFAAGLILDSVVFKNFDQPEIAKDLASLKQLDTKTSKKIKRIIYKHSKSHVDELIRTLSLIFSPIFFVYIGLQVDIRSLLNPSLYFYSLLFAAVAIAGKVFAGIAAKGSIWEKILVGMSMVPRGEVGLIFAATGKALGALSSDTFSMVVVVILITTFFAPPLVKHLLNFLKNSTKTSINEKPEPAFAKVNA